MLSDPLYYELSNISTTKVYSLYCVFVYLSLCPYTEETLSWRWLPEQGSISVPRWKALAVHVFSLSNFTLHASSIQSICFLPFRGLSTTFAGISISMETVFLTYSVANFKLSIHFFFFLILGLLSFAPSLCSFCTCVPSFSLKFICLYNPYSLWPLNNLP